MMSGLVPILADGGIEIRGVKLDSDSLKGIATLIITVGGSASGYLAGKFKYGQILKEGDFRLESDETSIEIAGQQSQTNLIVTVKRAFQMKARRKGRYRFVRELQGKTTTGKWDKATVYYRGQKVVLEKANNDSELKTKKTIKL